MGGVAQGQTLGDGELRLSIMASLAQEESRKTSNRVVWGQTRQMERGVVFGRSMLGYEVTDGNLIVEPEGAEIVRFIFQQYAEGITVKEIISKLTEKGRYEVQIMYSSSENRTESADVTVCDRRGAHACPVDMTEAPEIDGLWHSLGTFTFVPGRDFRVVFTDKGKGGVVVVDAVRFIKK